MSGTSAFFQRGGSGKSDIKTPVSTQSNCKVYEIESLICGQDRSLPTAESTLANSFLFISFSASHISTWDVVHHDIMEALIL